MNEPKIAAKTGASSRRGLSPLGRGLSALFGEEATEIAEGGARVLPVEKLHPGRFQPRRHFDQGALEQLTQSVKSQGVLVPILVRPHPDHAGEFEIIAGERRWRAAQAAQLHQVPVLVLKLPDRQALELALVENIQRADLTPLEEADGYRRLIEEFDHTQEELASVVGKSRSHIANMMRLLTLPDPVRDRLATGALTAGHARALVTATDPIGLAEEIVAQGLSVRAAEKLAAQGKSRSAGKPKNAPRVTDPDIRNLENYLGGLFGMPVAITFNGVKGTLTMKYASLEQLDGLLQRLKKEIP